MIHISKKLLLFSFSILLSCYVFPQKKDKKEIEMFLPVYNSYSPRKLSVVILNDGTRIEGYKKDVDRKKGQIYYIKIKDSVSGKKLKFEADQISEMYLYPGGLEKLSKTFEYTFDARQWENRNLENDILNRGYIYFKKHNVKLKNKKKPKDYLMQLVNPTFCKYIEVYGDPFAGETMGFGIGGINLAGGLDKSYYIKKGDDIFWLHKRDFKDWYDKLFGDSEEFKNTYTLKDFRWRDLGTYIQEYTKIMIAKE